MNPDSPSPPSSPAADPQRRKFLKKSLVVTLGGTAVGAAVCLGPLRRKRHVSGVLLTRVVTLDELPADGVPRSFPIYSSHFEAWNKLFGKPVGAVFLRRMSDGSLQALNAACPHAGCRVGYESDRKGYLCPCHKSSFTMEGKLADPKSQALRGLDELKVELRNDREVWVHFQDFYPGHAEQYPVI